MSLHFSSILTTITIEEAQKVKKKKKKRLTYLQASTPRLNHFVFYTNMVYILNHPIFCTEKLQGKIKPNI